VKKKYEHRHPEQLAAHSYGRSSISLLNAKSHFVFQGFVRVTDRMHPEYGKCGEIIHRAGLSVVGFTFYILIWTQLT